MTNPNDPAFPGSSPIPKREWHPADVKLYEKYVQHGLTKREYFAAMAMQGFLIAKLHDDKGVLPHLGPDQIVAQASLVMADALIAELNRQEKP